MPTRLGSASTPLRIDASQTGLGGLSALGVVAAGLVVVAFCGYSPGTNSLFWCAKAAALPAAAAAGAVPMASLLRRRDPAAIAAAAFVAVAALSTALAGNKTLALFGQYRQGTGLVFVAALAGAWAIGRRLGSRDIRLLETVALVAIGVNAVVAVAESLTDLSSYQLFLFEDRTTALMGNPIHAGTVAAGATALLAARSLDRWWPSVPLVAIAGLLAQTSGSRASVLVALAVLGAVLLRRRWTVAAGLAAALVVGLAIGSLVISAAAGAASTSSTARIAEPSPGGFSSRLHHWSIATRALADRPVLGSGPGTFGPATSRYRTLAIVRAEGPDRPFIDAHNIVVEYAVTTGLLGVGAFLAWLVLGLRHARGPLLWFALGMLALHLVQPQFAGTTPIALLALGAAAPRVAAQRLPSAWLVVPALVPGIVLGAVLVRGDAALRASELDFTIADAVNANRLLPRWTVTANQLAKLYSFEAVTTKDDRIYARVRAWRVEATRRDPAEAFSWNLLGEFDLARDDNFRAKADFHAALRADPQSKRAFLGLGEAERRLGLRDDAVRHLTEAGRRSETEAERRRVRQLIERAKTAPAP